MRSGDRAKGGGGVPPPPKSPTQSLLGSGLPPGSALFPPGLGGVLPWTAPAGCDGTPGALRPASGHPAGGLSRETPIPGTPRVGSGRAPSLRHPPCPFCSGGGTPAPRKPLPPAPGRSSPAGTERCGAGTLPTCTTCSRGGPGPQHPPRPRYPPRPPPARSAAAPKRARPRLLRGTFNWRQAGFLF